MVTRLQELRVGLHLLFSNSWAREIEEEWLKDIANQSSKASVTSTYILGAVTTLPASPRASS